jgi:hypothetical protein
MSPPPLEAEPRRARKPARGGRTRHLRRAEQVPYRNGTDLYLGGFGRYPILTREAEIELAQRIEEGERAILQALVRSPAALRELGAVGEELDARKLRLSDVLRAAEEEDLADEAGARRLVSLLRRASDLAQALQSGAPAAAGEQASILDELERARLHRRILDRTIGALRGATPVDEAYLGNRGPVNRQTKSGSTGRRPTVQQSRPALGREMRNLRAPHLAGTRRGR